MSGCCDGDVITGAQGPAGESAYQIWLDEGNTGTEADFLASLVGATGSQGPQGIQGPTGATGATGAAGPAGADGDDGASYLTGTGNPSVSLGEDGDTYSNNANGEIWTKNAGVWTFTGFSLMGPQGIQGPQGLTGATGAAGANGTNGTNGTDGLGYDNTISSTSTDILDTGATTLAMTWSTDKAYISGSKVRVADSSNPSVNYFEAVVGAYDQVTGSTSLIDIVNKNGSGTISSWNISITGDSGGGGGSSTDTNGIGEWNYVNTTSAPPSSGEIRFNNATVASATELYVFDTDANGVDRGSIINLLEADDYFVIQENGTPGNYIVVEFSSVTDNTTYVTYGINSITVVGTITSGSDFFLIPITKAGGGATPTLQSVLTAGNQTAGNDIEVSGSDKIYIASLRNLGNTGTSVTVDLSAGTDAMEMIVTDNFTLNFSNPTIGSGFINTYIGGAGGYTMTAGTNVELKNGGAPQTVSTVFGTKDRIYWSCDGVSVEINISKDLQ